MPLHRPTSINVFFRILFLAAGCSFSLAAVAQTPVAIEPVPGLACSNSLNVGLQDVAPTKVDENTIIFETGRFDALLREPGSATLEGGIVLRRGDRLAGANAAQLDAENRSIFLQGDVRYQDPGTEILSDSAEFGYDSGIIEFNGAEFSVGNNAGRGAAGQLTIRADGRLDLDSVSYTTCPPGSEDWLVEAKSIDLNTRTGVGTATGMKLRFKGVQILYAPYLSFPISNARKSGILTPEIGGAGRSGNQIRVPYYWNIAPNYDATLTSRFLTDRGFQGSARFRYLLSQHEGSINTELLPNDSLLNQSRHLVDLDHQSIWANGWRARLEARDVSDSQYFEDLGGSLSISSLTHLNRSVTLDYFGQNWNFLARVQDFQTLDEAIGELDEPYQRLPQFIANGRYPNKLLGADLILDSEIVNFDREVGVTGWRMNVSPRVEKRFGGPGWFVKPAVELDHTRYSLEDTAPSQSDTYSRSLPIASLDTGLILEREVDSERRGGLLQTLEPRLFYVHVPHRDQDGLPVFDTITPDLNLIQLFRPNRLLGADRIVDTDQLSIGVTSRIVELESGRELISATIGQALYLSESGVDLPGQSLASSRSSDYIAKVAFNLYKNVNFDFGHQWGTGDNGTTQSEARLQFQPSNNKILNLAYRFRRDTVEQGDLSWSWPLAKRWNFVGRYNYSFRDDEVLEQFFGLEYESCCWGLRLVSRRHISTRDGTRDSSFGLQLVLKGLSSVGSQADKLLERGILGYSARLR